MSQDFNLTTSDQLPRLSTVLSVPDDKERSSSVNEKVDPTTSSSSYYDDKASTDEDDAGVVFVKGDPVITSGRDVSRFLVDLRDDGDVALTFRSFALGTIFAGLGAALSQVCDPASPGG